MRRRSSEQLRPSRRAARSVSLSTRLQTQNLSIAFVALGLLGFAKLGAAVFFESGLT
jgi:hypothetical protein